MQQTWIIGCRDANYLEDFKMRTWQRTQNIKRTDRYAKK